MPAPILLTDCHAHLLQLPAQTVAVCVQEGIQILCQTAQPNEWEAALTYTQHPNVSCALGIHPFYCNTWDATTENLLDALLSNDTTHRIAAIGEIGLDTLHTSHSLHQQLRVLRVQLQLATRHHRPVCLHLCHAWEPFFQLLETLGIQHLQGYCHGFTGSREMAQRLLKLDLHLSFGKSLLLSPKTQQSLSDIPLQRLLVETDCPDRLAKPTQVFLPLEKLADIKHIPINSLAKQIRDNFTLLFKNASP